MQKLTELVPQLWPLLAPRVNRSIEDAINASLANGSSSVASKLSSPLGSMQIHELSSTWHIGTLTDAQAPQFLKLDGSRALTGNLAVDPGVTIDGTDISAHVSNANAHHNRLHGLTSLSDHSITGVTNQVLGLTANNTPGLLTPSSTPGALTLIRTDSSSSIQLQDLYLTGAIDFGVNTIFEDTTYLQVTGSKPLNFAQTLRATGWSLTTTGNFSGNIGIFNGAVDVAQDFTVGNNILFADVSAQSVGINCAPDLQFALDVNGPARAQYFIGPHAIQLKNALLISHFDGPEHGNNGELNGHKGQVPVTIGDIFHRRGKFNKALEVSESETNLIINSSFETDITGWTDYAFGAGTATRARTDEEAWDGDYSYKITKTGGAATDQVGARTTFAVTTGLNYAFTVWVKIADAVGRTGAGLAYLYCDTTFTGTSVNTTVMGEWVQLRMNATSTSTGTGRVYVWIDNCLTGTIYIDAIQVTQSLAYRPYVDGTRAASLVYYQKQSLNWPSCTIMGWFRIEDTPNRRGVHMRIFEARADGNNRINLRVDSATNKLTGFFNGQTVQTNLFGTNAVAANVWNHFAYVINDTAVEIYLNGVLEASATVTTLPLGLASIYIGCYSGGTGVEPLNGQIDDFAVVNEFMTQKGILAVYESNAPVFAETSTWNWRTTPKGLVWADDEGLWMRDVTGNTVFGIYGGEAAIKSWGGFNMAVGDLVIGKNAVGSAAIWWDQNLGKFGFYGGGSGTAQVEIGTDGSLQAAAGKLKLNTNGINLEIGTGLVPQSTYSFTSSTYSLDGGIACYRSGTTTLELISYMGSSAFTNVETIMDASNSKTGGVARSILSASTGASFGDVRVVAGVAALDWSTFEINTEEISIPNLPISTGAVGAYAGKIQVKIDGAYRWIPYYSS